jgi:hypothetical protein
MLHEHRVLTTTQITQLAFGTGRAATARLLTLYQLRAIDRFRPLTPAGSAPLHFVLDEAGAHLLAAEDGITPSQLGYRRDRALAIALSAQLTHTTGTNSVFCALAAQGRQAGDAALTCWWSERRCAALWGDLARPDGYGQWTEQAPGGPVTTDFFLEYDTGSENLHRVATKLTGYRDLAARTGITTPVLFWLPAARREAGLRALLATTAPAGAIWLPAGQPGLRLSLAQAGGTTPAQPSATGQQADDSAAAGTGLPWHPPLPRHHPCRAVPARPCGGGDDWPQHRGGPDHRGARRPRPHRRVRRPHAAPARTRAAAGRHQASAHLPRPGRLDGGQARTDRAAAGQPSLDRRRRGPGRPVRRRLHHLVLCPAARRLARPAAPHDRQPALPRPRPGRLDTRDPRLA